MSAKNFKSVLILLILVYCINQASAQWIQQFDFDTVSDIGTDGYFINENTGWVCTGLGKIFRTTNGGTNWNLISDNSSESYYGIHFINQSTGFVIAGIESYKSTNGGSNWIQMTTPNTQVCTGVHFINSTTGWIYGFVGNIIKTTDAGNSWVLQTSGTNEALNAMYFNNSSTGWAVGYNGAALKTTNGGNNWQLQSFTSLRLQDINFYDNNNGAIAAENSRFFRTTNGGQNWTEGICSGNINNLSCYFFNQSIGFMGGSAGLWRTIDGGTNWEYAGVLPRPYTLQFIGGCGYSMGDFIYKTSNGGFNLDSPTNLSLTAVSTSQINLTWTDNSSDEEKFIIERSTDGNNWSTLDSVSASVTSYQNTGLSADQLYYYRVYGKKLIFSSGYSTSEWVRTPMVAPTLSSPEAGTVIPFVPVLQWTTAPNAFTYTLQVASDTNFSNIVYTIIAPGLTSSPVPPANLQNSTRYYWRVRVSSLSNNSLFTPYRDFIFQNPNYGNNMSSGNNLYYFANSTSGANAAASKPVYNWRDTTGSTYLIQNGSLRQSLFSGTIDDGLFRLNNILSGGNAIRFFGNNYQTLYIGTNGIVSFSSFNPQSGINIDPPAGGLAQAGFTNAILPLWKDFNFGDADVTGRTLCYKINPNEIIISYIKVPSYNSSDDANDYVSFQIIIQYTANPPGNSKINYMYNYDQTGSSFITKYNDNTIYTHLVGLKDTSGQEFQYRFFNSSFQLINSGPIFSSNLGIEFGPNVNALPVELASFTSQVNGSSVKLNWTTVNEQNNSGFEIQRTIANENNFKKISFIQGSGTTNESKNYSYEDRNITSGKYQYRLKQIDFNGNFEYHTLANEVEIGVPKKFSLSQNYPNPFNPATKINFEIPKNSKVKLAVYDVTGKLASELVNEQRAAGYYTVEFNGANLSSGMYFYRIEAGDFSAVKKMVLVK